MEAYIRYQRFEKELIVGSEEYQEFLNTFVKDGWDIIYYDEQSVSMFAHRVVILAGKRQENTLKKVL
jgi:hypothetical protein